MLKKSPLKATRLAQRKRRILLIKIISVVVLVVLILAGASWITHLKSLSLTKIEVVGNSGIDTADIEEVIQRNTRGNYLMLFSKANRFLYPKDAIERDLLATFTRLESVELDAKKFTTLVVIVDEREPSYVWCNGAYRKQAMHECYYLDADGYIFADAPVFSGNAFFAFYGDIGFENPVGSRFTEPEKFHRFDALIKSVQALDLPIHALAVEGTSLNTLYLDRGGKVLFKDTQDFDLIASNLELLKNSTDILKAPRQADLEYIDLRFGNKVYYKIAGDNGVEAKP